jgi:serine protease Do
VDSGDQVTVTLNDGRKFNSKKVSTDRRTDLAVVVLDTKETNFPYLELGDSEAMQIGDHVLAVGAPFGLAGTVTHGIVSAKGRNGLQMNMYEDFIQTDAAINPGNSGGPLVNMDGKVIGINAAIKSRSGGFQGIGLAVASNLAQGVIRSLRTEGTVHRGYLGVQIRDLNPDVASRLGLAKHVGVVVGEVMDNGPAAKAGLQPGDVIVAVNGKEVKDGKQLQQVVAQLPLKKAAQMEVVRDGKKMSLPVTIDEQPAEFGTAELHPAPRRPSSSESISLDKLGLEISELTDEQAEEMGFRRGTQGVVITRVQPETPASESGLRRGMLITKIDNHRITSASQARRALERASLADGVLLQVQSPTGGTNFVLLRSKEAASK